MSMKKIDFLIDQIPERPVKYWIKEFFSKSEKYVFQEKIIFWNI
jgi:hypothetical protein